MATVTALTADKTLEVLGETVTDGDVVGDNLILTKLNGDQINAGNVRGPKGDQGAQGASAAPGDVNPTPNTTPIRTANGQVQTDYPTHAYDATNKQYTDNNIAGLAGDISEDLNAVKILTTGVELASTDDLNQFKTAGTWLQSDNSEATLALHYPLAGAAGILEVFKSTTKTLQRYTPHLNSGAVFYVRTFDGTSWTAWSIFEELTDTGWIAPSLQNGWVNYSPASGGDYAQAGYRKRNGLVYIKGLIKSGTIATSTLIFTLPTGYKPVERVVNVCLGNAAVARVDVLTDGTVVTQAGVSAAFTSLNFPPFFAA